MAIYETVTYFIRMLEARHFTFLAAHSLLTFSFQQKRNKHSPRHLKYLDYISQFTTDIRHISGQDNIVADALSRVEAIAAPVTRDALTAADDDGVELRALLENTTALKLEKILIPGTSVELYSDTSAGNPRPYVPSRLGLQVFGS